MRVRLDESRGNVTALGIDDALTVGQKVVPNFRNQPVLDANIRHIRGCAGAIDDCAALNENIRHHILSSPLRIADPKYRQIGLGNSSGELPNGSQRDAVGIII